MKRAILWCGQVEADKRPQTYTIDERLSKKERRRADTTLEARSHYDDLSFQVNGLELAFQAACKLGVSKSEIYACLVQANLAPRDLQTDVRGATQRDLERLLCEIAECSESTDALLFIAVNHGASTGLTTAETVFDPMREDEDTILTPTQLEKYLAIIDGPQVLIISTCHSGLFLSLGRQNRCVVAACGANEYYLAPRIEDSRSPFLDELFGAWCECTQDAGVPCTTLPLDDAFAQAKERMSRVQGLRVPLMAGSTVWPSTEKEITGRSRKTRKHSD